MIYAGSGERGGFFDCLDARTDGAGERIGLHGLAVVEVEVRSDRLR